MIICNGTIYYGKITDKFVRDDKEVFLMGGMEFNSNFDSSTHEAGEYIILVMDNDRKRVISVDAIRPRFNKNKEIIELIDSGRTVWD